jgi:hypothetical protein
VIYCRGPKGTGELWVLPGYAKGLYQTPALIFSNSTHMTNAKITVADVTGDGKADVIFAKPLNGSVEFFVAPGRPDKQLVTKTWGKRLALLGRPLDAIHLA